MCDYSLVAVASRPARVADRLITTGFQNSSTRGFASTEDMKMAVCLRPGTEIAFDHPPYYHRLWRRTAASNVARFRQINLEVQTTHHDALEFSDGTVVPVTKMFPGQHATVLQLPSGADGQIEPLANTESLASTDSTHTRTLDRALNEA